eukprot:3717514-Prymnesium_polylepis.1
MGWHEAYNDCARHYKWRVTYRGIMGPLCAAVLTRRAWGGRCIQAVSRNSSHLSRAGEGTWPRVCEMCVLRLWSGCIML